MNEAQRRAAARVGQTLREKWRLDALIGCGGMAAVYSATHRNGKRAAVKLLHPEWSGVEEVRQRFLREGYVANRVGHQGAVSVLDDDVAEDGSVFLVMELLEGATLDACAADRPGKKLEVEEAVGVADQLLEVLAAAHEQGIVHRDIKPENLFVTRGSELKVLDFGIARLREGDSPGHTTVVGSLLGTPAFMAPEQASGRWGEVDGRTDLWAVGATMYTLLAGTPVHEADTLPLLIATAITKPAPSIRGKRPDLPPALADVIDRALAYDSSRRFADAREMQAALRAAAGASSVATPGPVLRTLVSARLPGGAARAATPHHGPSLELSPPSQDGATTARAVSSRAVAVPTNRGPARLVVGLVVVAGLAGAGWLLLGGRAPDPAPVLVVASPARPSGGVDGASAPTVAPAFPAAAPAEPAPSALPAPTASPPGLAPSSRSSKASPAASGTPTGPAPASTPAPPKPRHDDGF